ncbi:hypothetical protein CDL15_Pgr028716 [Punica granatum]|uniref:Uncharacterized protein n=1 Tax=Punica granatum TaxID=22663 RepID=A0A218VXQ8_PUNGR|nr:hypothetical protein CDL15_Pgr028716 [Punica granatum]PKI49978.1 hypothetical protein CRG98_029652 [Punica granatum]
MEGKRVYARPCSERRVVAAKKKPRWWCSGRDGFVNNVRKLQRREINSKRDCAFSMTDARKPPSEAVPWMRCHLYNGVVTTKSHQQG